MKTAIVFLVLLATVYCHPVKRSASSSESSEEVVRPSRLQLNAAPGFRKISPAQPLMAGSDESSDSSDEAQALYTASDTASDDSVDTDDNNTESDESEEPTTEPPFPFETTPSPVTPSPATPSPATPSPVTDSGRGDNLGYPSDYKKSIIYVESNKIEKGASQYKYYDMDKAIEGMGLVSKKASVYDRKHGNDIEKNLKVYKALQVHNELLEEGASTPEVESQGLDTAGGLAEEPTHRQAELEPEATPAAEIEGMEEEEESASAGDSASASTSEEESKSSEEATATPGAADDSDSSESTESQEGDSSEAAVVVTAK